MNSLVVRDNPRLFPLSLPDPKSLAPLTLTDGIIHCAAKPFSMVKSHCPAALPTSNSINLLAGAPITLHRWLSNSITANTISGQQGSDQHRWCIRFFFEDFDDAARSRESVSLAAVRSHWMCPEKRRRPAETHLSPTIQPKYALRRRISPIRAHPVPVRPCPRGRRNSFPLLIATYSVASLVRWAAV